nr:uncharacterized protein LOC111405738 isoform X2 [Ipomoea batatas]GME09865.1 uncharacterized protein LOC111405738 isoform X2 [Ipomoea batatas]
MWRIMGMNQGVRLYVFVESAMKQSLKAPTPWKLLVDVLEPLSLRTEIAYRDGAMKRETQSVKFVYRNMSLAIRLHRLKWSTWLMQQQLGQLGGEWRFQS